MTSYALLTVGDGLVSQIPALLISTGTGLVVTRASSEANLGTDLLKQLFGNNPSLLFIVGAVLIAMDLDHFPAGTYITLGIIFITVAFIMKNNTKKNC